jgi:N utilization substance protein B
VKLTDAEQEKLNESKLKYFVSKKEQKFNRKLANNILAQKLRTHFELIQFINKYDCKENDNNNYFIKIILDEINKSNNYMKYTSLRNTYSDYEFWEDVFKQIILKSFTVSEWLEQKNIYWNDDLEIITVFVLKTLKQFQYKIDSNTMLFPMFKNIESKEFAIKLLQTSIIEGNKNSDLINIHMKNWDKKHIAMVDLIIMQMALSEINNFPSIPLKVTLNEYINLAHYYSTPKSAPFVNGILQAIIHSLKINK